MSKLDFTRQMAWRDINAVVPHFKPNMLEGFLFDKAREHSDYAGGLWRAVPIFTLPGTTRVVSLFVPPEREGGYAVERWSNGYEGQMSALTFGAALTLEMVMTAANELHGISGAALEDAVTVADAIKDVVYGDDDGDHAEVSKALREAGLDARSVWRFLD